MIQEPETRSAYDWREYRPRVWPSVPVSPTRRVWRSAVRIFDAYCFWLSRLDKRIYRFWLLIVLAISVALTLSEQWRLW